MDQSSSQSHSNGLRNFLIFAAIFWIILCTSLPLLKFYSPQNNIPWLILIYCGFTVCCSLAAFIAYGIDKRRAKKDQYRISEKKLHLFSLLGGWPGSYLAQQFFRHKTRKVSFRLVFWVIVFLHIGIISYGIYLWIKIS